VFDEALELELEVETALVSDSVFSETVRAASKSLRRCSAASACAISVLRSSSATAFSEAICASTFLLRLTFF
jgi:hypothetical protein